MIPQVKAKLLEGKKGLVVGIANDQSIAWGCARAFRALGAELAVTYLNDKAKPHVEPLARELDAPILMPLDVAVPRLQPDDVGQRRQQLAGVLDEHDTLRGVGQAEEDREDGRLARARPAGDEEGEPAAHERAEHRRPGGRTRVAVRRDRHRRRRPCDRSAPAPPSRDGSRHRDRSWLDCPFPGWWDVATFEG